MLQITSRDFKNNEEIDTRFTCDGESECPTLEFSGVPEGTKSLAVIVDDPDAPTGLFTHWIVANIPIETKFINNNVLPEGAVEGLNSNHKVGWIAPCPPYSTHHYHFFVYALDTTIKFTKNDNKLEFINLIDGHVIESAEIITTYKRK